MNTAVRDWLDNQRSPTETLLSSQEQPVSCDDRRTTPQPDVPWVQCSTCDKLYSSTKSLKIHLRIHTGYKPYACHMCPKTFSQTNALKAHIDAHTGRRDWLCKFCNKAFTQSAHLRTHQKIHEQKKDYECFFCNQAFGSKGVRDRHIRQHTGEKPYKCTLCSKTFTRGESLKFHNNSHQGLRPYHCPKEGCASTFTKACSLKRHIGTCHAEAHDKAQLLRSARKRVLIPIIIKQEEYPSEHRREPSPQFGQSRSEGSSSRSTSCSLETIPYADDVAPDYDYDVEMQAIIKDLGSLELLERLERYVEAIAAEEALRANQNQLFRKREEPQNTCFSHGGTGANHQAWHHPYPVQANYSSGFSQTNVGSTGWFPQCEPGNYPIKCETPFSPMPSMYPTFGY